MSLQIIQKPQLVLRNSPSEIVFLKRNPLTTTGGYARLLLVFVGTSAPASGNTLVLEQDGVEWITFTFNNGTTRTSLPYSGYGSFALLIEAVAQRIYQHPSVKADYEVNYLGYEATGQRAVVELIARQRGTVYNLTVGTSTVTLGTSTEATVSEDVTLENYQLNVSVEVQSDPMGNPSTERVDDLVITGVLNADVDEIKIPLHEVPLISGLQMGADVPLNPRKAFAQRKQVALLKVEAVEEYTSATDRATLLNDGDWVNALNIGLPLYMTPAEGTLLDFVGDDRFYNMQPGRKKMIDEDSPEWLTVGVTQNATHTVSFRIFYSDSTNSSTSYTVDVLKVAGAYVLPTGWGQCSLGSVQPLKTAVYYEVKVTVGGSPITETFTYVMDRRQYQYKRYFIFQNSLGAIDTLRCVGVNKYTIKRKAETGGQTWSSTTRMHQGTLETITDVHEEIWTMRTGWLLNKAEKEFLTDFLHSKYIAEVTLPLLSTFTSRYGGGTGYYVQPMRKCLLEQDTIEMWEENEGSFGLEWKMKWAHDEISWSNLTRRKEEWFDSCVEFVVKVNGLNTAPNRIIITPTASNFEVLLNGADEDWSSGHYNVAATGIYHFVVNAAECSSLVITAAGIDADITITKIETGTINTFSLQDFDSIKGDYLTKRIRNWYRLRDIDFETTIDPGFNLQGTLAALSHLHQSGYSAGLTNISFANSTPDNAGEAIRDYLDGEGITITTA